MFNFKKGKKKIKLIKMSDAFDNIREDLSYEAYICSIECDREFTNKLFKSENQEDECCSSII